MHTPAEAVLRELLTYPLIAGKPEWGNWFTWVRFLPLAAIALLAMMQYRISACNCHRGRPRSYSSRLTKTYAFNFH